MCNVAERFVDVTCREFGILPKRLSPEGREALVAFDWKRNNVRELRNAIERAVVAAQGETIRAADLPAAIAGAQAPDRSVIDESFQGQRASAERRIVLAALEKHDWHITRTAEALASPIMQASSRSCTPGYSAE
jgi:DNA-binding NtrC family response regulator